jgi:TatD DNase family protein
MKLFDSHSHIQEKEFDTRRGEVLTRMREGGVGTIVVGCDYESSKRAVELAQHEEYVWACIGMHPVDTQTMFEDGDFTGLIGAKKANGTPAVVAVGECGLDYFRLDPSSADYPGEVARQTQGPL